MPNDSIRAGRCSGPRWIQTLSTSMRPPRSPASDQRRAPARAQSPQPHGAPPRDRREPAAPGDEAGLSILEERRAHLDPDPPYEPKVVRQAPPRLLDVV